MKMLIQSLIFLSAIFNCCVRSSLIEGLSTKFDDILSDWDKRIVDVEGKTGLLDEVERFLNGLENCKV